MRPSLPDGTDDGREHARLKDAGSNPFIEPERLQEFVAEKEQEFRTELAKQKADAQSDFARLVRT